MLVPLHGIASRHDLPLPFSFVVVGAVLALTISFVILIFAWRRPRFERVGGPRCQGLTAVVDHPIVRLVARVLVLATYAWAGLAMMAGQDLLDQSDLRLRLCVDVGRPGSDLAAARSILARNQPAAEHPSRSLRLGSRRPGAGPRNPADLGWGVAGR